MFAKILLSFGLFTLLSAQVEEIEVSYYKELILLETAKAKYYSPPNNASEYEPSVASRPEDLGKFDYIIVGGGSAGSVIATRLSEYKHLNILLVEAGDSENDFTDIPAMLYYSRASRYNWNYKTVPQINACLAMENKECPIPTGRGLGGTTIINNLMYVRGNKRDFDNWERMGNLGWSYQNVLKYFIKSEDSQINGNIGYHGKKGYLNVDYTKPPETPLPTFIIANEQLGRSVVDYNGRKQLGVSPVQMNVLEGKRLSARRAFLDRALDRKNLKIMTNSLVTKIIIDQKLKAEGIQISNSNGIYTAWASREIIVSAGPIASPQLLMLSGIRPKDTDLSLPFVKELAVGENYSDRVAVFGLFFTMNDTHSMPTLTESIEEYLLGRGFLTMAENIQGITFLQTKLAKIQGVPDIAIILTPCISKDNFTQSILGYSSGPFKEIWDNIDVSKAFMVYVVLLYPKSRGTIKLKSLDPYSYPIIDPNSLSHDEDLETLYLGIQMVRGIMDTVQFREINATLYDTTLPSCQNYTRFSEDYWKCQIKQQSMLFNHPVGTCKMGPNPRNGAVVNNRLQVHGIRNLRVADASIFPTTTSGAVSTISMMIGEYVSDMIKNEIR